MSRHRIKTIDFVDDYGGGDEEGECSDDNPASLEDRELMRLGAIEVRELLDSENPPVPASDQEIWEALWHYYYDVDKSVGYLRSVYSPRSLSIRHLHECCLMTDNCRCSPFVFSLGWIEKYSAIQARKTTKTQAVAAADVGIKQARANGQSKLANSI